jgi:hypothetical protein
MENQYLIDDFKLSESWRLFKILGEFVDGVENLHELGPAVTIFGSARIKPEDPVYQKAVEIAAAFAKEGFDGSGQQRSGPGRRALGGVEHQAAL